MVLEYEKKDDQPTDTEWEDRHLAGLEFVPADLAERLAEYHIGTVEALLGATRGLLDPIAVGEEYEVSAAELAAHLAGMVPPQLLERFREPLPPIPPPGVLPPDPDPTEEE